MNCYCRSGLWANSVMAPFQRMRPSSITATLSPNALTAAKFCSTIKIEAPWFFKSRRALTIVAMIAGASPLVGSSIRYNLRSWAMARAKALKDSLWTDNNGVKRVTAYKISTTDRLTGRLVYYVCGSVDRRAGFTTYNHVTNEIISGPDDIITDRYFALIF